MDASGAGGGAGSAAATSATTTSPAPICSSRTWFGRCAVVFHRLKQSGGATGAELPVEALCAASRLMAESYGFMFGPKGMVTGVLNKDVEDNTGGLERAAARLVAGAPPSTLGTPVQVEELLALECVAGGARGVAWGW
jgi:hypothetical protein